MSPHLLRLGSWQLAGHLAVAVLAAKFGYDFGILLGGAPMGFLMAANAAVFAWFMAAAATDALERFKRH